MLGTPVVVVFFNIPVASPDKDVPFILTTVAALPTEVTSPVKLAFVVTVEAVKLVAVPVILVPTKVVGVPRLGAVKVLFSNVSAPALVANIPVVGRVTFVVAVEVKVVEYAPAVIKELPPTKVNIAGDAGTVIVSLFIDVAVAAPSAGVVNVGPVPNTAAPVPVAPSTAANNCAVVKDPNDVILPTEVM